MSGSKQESVQWLQQAMADFCNMLPLSARGPVAQAARYHLANATSDPAPPVVDSDPVPEKL